MYNKLTLVLVLMSTFSTWSTAVNAQATKRKLPLRVCVGQSGSSYDQASAVFSKELQKSGLFEVNEGVTAGALENLESIYYGHCDVAFTRSDVMQHFNTLLSTSGVIGNTTLIPLEDGTPYEGKSPDSDLMPYEIYREYAQLVCNRSMNVSDIKDLKSKASTQIKEVRDMKKEIAYNQGYEARYEADYQFDRSPSNKRRLDDIRKTISDLKAKLSTIERNTITVYFVRESGQATPSGDDLGRAGEAVFWKTLLQEDDGYQNINVKMIDSQPGYSSFDVALQNTMNNTNACFLNVDRLGENNFLQKIDKNKAYYDRLKLVELNDWDFNNTKVNGVRVYSFVDIRQKNIFSNLRSESPNAWFFKWRYGKETLAVRSLIVTEAGWYNRIRNNPFAVQALQKAVFAIKADPKLKDPMF